MKREFEMSMVGELNYFLGLQVKQWEDGIFIFQEKYAKNLSLDSKKHTSTPMSSLAKLSCDATGVEVDPTLYRSMIQHFNSKALPFLKFWTVILSRFLCFDLC